MHSPSQVLGLPVKGAEGDIPPSTGDAGARVLCLPVCSRGRHHKARVRGGGHQPLTIGMVYGITSNSLQECEDCRAMRTPFQRPPAPDFLA